jgi:FKBP-type peptidyl-prolyl cis-trans isomerase (trigger factor)
MTREEIEERMDELARKYVETRNKKIVDELYELARELEKLKKSHRLKTESSYAISQPTVTIRLFIFDNRGCGVVRLH